MRGPRCPACQTFNRPGVRFCTLCGARIDGPLSGDLIALRFRTDQLRRPA